MRKSFLYILLTMIMLFTCACGTTDTPNNNDQDPPSPPSPPDPPAPVGHEVITDNTFSKGFQVMGPAAINRDKWFYIDYLGTVDATQSPWEMARWWCPEGFDSETSTAEKVGDNYVYTDNSKVVKVNPETGYLYLELNASKVYEHPRKNGENWPHLLIEQSFEEQFKINKVSKIIASITFTVEKLEMKMSQDEYNPGLHAAQFLWYFTLTNRPSEGTVEEVGTPGDYLWFGVPLVDSRQLGGMTGSYNIDSGVTGSTNKMIYAMPSNRYLPPITVGERYQVEVDILPYMQNAFNIAQSSQCLKNVKFENLAFTYMNLGFELPGTFDMAVSIEKLSTVVYE